MSKRKPTTTALLDETATFARALLKRVSKGTVAAQEGSEEPSTPVVDVDTQIAALSVVTRWVAVMHKIRPPEEDDSDFDRLRSKLGVGGKPGGSKTKRGAGGTTAPAQGNGSLVDAINAANARPVGDYGSIDDETDD